MTHTKGNWIADLRGGCCAVYPEHLKDDTNGCHSYDKRNIFFSDKDAKYNKERGFWEMSEEMQANAKLIAAAPDLLKALNRLVSSYRADFEGITGGKLNNTEAIKEALNAIKKATE